MFYYSADGDYKLIRVEVRESTPTIDRFRARRRSAISAAAAGPTRRPTKTWRSRPSAPVTSTRSTRPRPPPFRACMTTRGNADAGPERVAAHLGRVLVGRAVHPP